MDFKNFCNEQLQSDNKYERIHIDNTEEDIKNQAKQSFEKYANLSNEQLMQELINVTNQKKSDGTLDGKKIQDMYSAISSILPAENKKNLDDIFDRLK